MAVENCSFEIGAAELMLLAEEACSITRGGAENLGVDYLFGISVCR